MSVELFKMDAVEWLNTLPAKSVDLVITDIPYESMEKWRNIGTTTRLKVSDGSSNSWFPVYPDNRLRDLFINIYNVMKNNTHFYFFSDVETMFTAVPIAKEVGFKFHKPVVWDKCMISTGYHYRNSYEFILFFEKGKRKLNSNSIPDILTAKALRKTKAQVFYPTQKPKQLIDILIMQSSKVGDLVIDPFMGSGVVGASAVSQQRNFKGCDILQASLDYADHYINTSQSK